MYQKVSSIEKFYVDDGCITSFCRNLLSHSTKKLREAPFCVAESFWYLKMLGIREGGGGYHDFPLKLFCLTVQKHFVEAPFCISEKF